MQLHPVAAYHGPSPVGVDPVVVAELRATAADYGELTRAIPALQSASADWYQPPESTVDPGVGAFLAGWALQALTFVNGYLHDAGGVTDPATGRTLLWVGFHDPQLSLAALDLGARWLDSLARRGGDDLRGELDALWARCRQLHPDYQARIVMEAARARGVPYAPAWGLDRYWRFGQGERSRVLFESSSGDDSRVGSWVSQSKLLTKWTLRSLGIPTPAFRIVEDESELEQAVAEVGFPCVTKPIDQFGGRGVTSGLTGIEVVRDGYAAARACTEGPVMVEAHIEGDDHRLMMIDGRFAAAIRREPPTVTGDGRRTIAELVAAKNIGRDPRSLVRSGYFRPIVLDASAMVHLAGLGLHSDTVLDAGRTVPVRSNSNLTTGGECLDVTEQVHPDIRSLAETIAQTLNLAMLGADFLTTDIAASPADSGGQFNELNITPGLEAMIAAGWPAERAGALALGEAPGRIPLHLLVVPVSALDTTLASLRARRWPPGAGWASWDRAVNAGAELTPAAGPAWPGVQALLGHRTLSHAVIVATDDQIYEYGLPQRVFTAAQLACALDPMWLAVLRTCCAEVSDNADPVAAVLESLG